ncbi:hypothetical protein C8R43DRAFT_861234, partial [Mycena crocata]
ILYINKTIPSSIYKQNTIKSSFITSVSLTLHSRTIHIFSIYNPPASDDTPICDASRYITSLGPLPPDHSLLLTGDFNRHHPSWSGI